MIMTLDFDAGNVCPIRVLIADKDPRVCRGLLALLEATPGVLVVAETVSPAHILAQIEDLCGSVIVLDVEREHPDAGLQFLRDLAGTGCLVVAMSTQVSLRDVALEAGAFAFIEKGAQSELVLEELHRATRHAVERASWVGRDA